MDLDVTGRYWRLKFASCPQCKSSTASSGEKIVYIYYKYSSDPSDYSLDDVLRSDVSNHR